MLVLSYMPKALSPYIYAYGHTRSSTPDALVHLVDMGILDIHLVVFRGHGSEDPDRYLDVSGMTM